MECDSSNIKKLNCGKIIKYLLVRRTRKLRFQIIKFRQVYQYHKEQSY